MEQFQSVQILNISAERAGQRLDNFLIRIAKGVPKSRIYRAIRKGEVRINKKRAKPDTKLEAGDDVRIPPLVVKAKTEFVLLDNTRQLLCESILYEDDSLIVLNKPAGMAVHGGTGTDFSLIMALRQVKPEYHQLELVHRLDKDTSGCLMVAKNLSALRDLQQQLKSHEIEKHYSCLVEGTWTDENLHVRAPLRKNVLRSGERMVIVTPDGKQAHTEFHCQQQYTNAALVHAHLHTGRTHQIRAHLRHISHPLAGDTKYGDRKFNQQMQDYGLKRLFLHAHHLKFCLPGNKKAITVTAPLDDDLNLCLQNLAKTAN